MKRLRRAALGLDISDASLCVVELRGTAKGLQLGRSAIMSTPAGCVRDGVVVDVRATARAVKDLLRRGRIRLRDRSAVVSLSGPAAVIRVGPVAEGGPSSVREHLQQETRRYAAFTGERTVTDFAIVETARSDARGRTVLRAAAKEDAAAALVRTVMKAGLVPVAIDLGPLAVARALHRRHLSTGPSEARILVSIEARAAHFLIFRAGGLCFLRTLNRPGGLLEESPEGTPPLASEVQSVLDFYRTEFSDGIEVRGIVLVADHLLPPELGASVSASLGGLKTEVCTPATVVSDAGILDDESQSRPTPAAVGLALRSLGETYFPFQLNLLPPETVRVQTLKRRALVTAVLVASLFLCAGLGAIAARWRINRLQKEVYEEQKTLAGMVIPPPVSGVKDSNAVQASEIAQASAEIAARQNALTSAGIRVPWPRLLQEIRDRIPGDVRLSSLRSERSGSVILEGESFSILSVYRFVELLSDCDLVRNAQLSAARTSGSGDEALSHYTIVCQVLPPTSPSDPEGVPGVKP